MMAEHTSAIKNRIIRILENDVTEGRISRFFRSIKEDFIPELSVASFADMYAQTLTCGTLSVRLMEIYGFKINEISSLISKKSPLLKEFFANLQRTQEYIPDHEDLGIASFIDQLNDYSVEAILEDSSWEEEGKDPIIQFYELFLKEYNPDQRMHRGVFYTPEPIVGFIVRSVDHFLRTEFSFSDGLADTKMLVSQKGAKIPQIQILDPAIGTGTFLKHVIKEIKSIFDAKHRHLSEQQLTEKWSPFILNHILPRLSGFEILMAPYAIAYLRIGLLLQETRYDFSENRPLRIYLANALQSPNDEIITKQGNEVLKPLLVVLGNPPYAVSSQNKGSWVTNLLEAYKIGINEKKISLNDDFIKFIRYGQWRIDKVGHGILAYITNNSFLDGLTHRMMRRSLLKSFDKIYILDLHGNAMKQERTPTGEKDENIFDIQQGICISFFIKTGEAKPSRIFHRDLFGDRESKYQFLLNSTIQAAKWSEITPEDPYFFFIPKNFSLRKEYYSYFALNRIFRQRTYGIQTKRDKITICFEKETLKHIILDFINLPEEVLRKKYQLPPDGRDWKISRVKADLTQIGWAPELVARIQYRPFDYRYTYYHNKSKSFVAYPRYNSMKHMLLENVGLISMRQVFQDTSYSHFGVTKTIIDERTFYSNRGGTYLFPLYYYEGNEAEVNLSEDFIKFVESKTGLRVAKSGESESAVEPKSLFYYIYSIFHSKTYRTRYSEFLKIDFPRVPVTSSKELFLYL
ncbi:MAG: type ISP restriction/modification enzyme, partial [Candidatus Hodarchaeota archaeon]